MIVVDAGVLEALTLGTADTEAAREAFLRDFEWVAPPLWRSDFRGSLYRRIRAGSLTRAAAVRAFDDACAIIAGNEPEPVTATVLDLALRLGLDMYDAEFVAIAEELGLMYVCSDPGLAELVPGKVIGLGDFAGAGRRER